MGKTYFVDISWTFDGGKRGREKKHVVYDGERLRETATLTSLEDASEIYIDSLSPKIYDDLLVLLRQGVKVYLVRKLKLIKKFRDKFKMGKSDENDAIVLSLMPKDAFRPVTLEEVEIKASLHPLVQKWASLSKRLKTLKRWENDGIKSKYLPLFKKDLEREKDRLEKEIMKVAKEKIEMYRWVEEELGLHGASLARLLLYVDFSKGLRKIKNFIQGNKNAKTALTSLAFAIYSNARQGRGPEKYRNYIKSYEGVRRKDAIKKLRSIILKDLRRLWCKHNEGRSI